MRLLIKVSIPAESGNRAVKDGSLGRIVEEFAKKHRPEAAYFTTDGGERTAFFVVTATESSEMPPMAESFFMGLNARVEFRPVMNIEDLKTGLQKLAG